MARALCTFPRSTASCARGSRCRSPRRPKIGEEDRAIGKYIAELVRDGDCLQLGIGAVPDAVCSFLGDKHDLGLHTEMISDGRAAAA